MQSESRQITFESELPPLRLDEGGAVRVGDTRVTLDLVVSQYENGATPEELVRAYDVLTLADVYGTIGYYLRHKSRIQEYLKQREAEAGRLRTVIEAARPTLTREVLEARRAAPESNHAAAGQ
jgi:uncharacterized protein (DUF433 family)